MKNIIISILFFVGSFSAIAQVKDSIVDALKLKIEKAETDSIRLTLKADLGNRLAFFDRSIAKEVHLEVEKELNNKEYSSYHYQQLKAEVLYSLSSMHSNLGENSEALRYANLGHELASSIDYHRISGKCISNIGGVYKKMNAFDKAKKYYKRALEIQKKDTVARGRVISYNRLGALYVEEEKYDSAIYFFNKALAVPKITEKYQIRVRTNIANTYMKEHKYDIAEKKLIENLAFLNSTGLYQHLANNHLSLAKVYKKNEDYHKATSHIDSAIGYAKKVRSQLLLKWSYSRKAEIAHDSKDYIASREAFLIYDKYKDSLISQSRTKRLADLEYAYQFQKEKQLAAVHLKNESTKKRLYFALIFVVLLLAGLTIYFIIKRKERKIALAENELKVKEIEKLRTDLALVNRENELKKVVVENSITEEILNKTLGDIKQIITFENKNKRQLALKSLFASLLSEKESKGSTSNLQNYLDKIGIDFKIRLDTHSSVLKPKEKELLCMMKLGLSSTEISKLFNTTLPSVKSSRYRIRKKLGLESDDDIIASIESKNIRYAK